MAFVSLVFPKFSVAQRLLSEYEKLYFYEVDYYMVDDVDLQSILQSGGRDMYLDYVVNYFSMLEPVRIPVRIGEVRTDQEEQTLGHILSTGFTIFVLDNVLREKGVGVRKGDVVASSGIFSELARMKDEGYRVFTRPAFVRLVQSVSPHSYVLQQNNVLEWAIMVSDTDVVFRYYV